MTVALIGTLVLALVVFVWVLEPILRAPNMAGQSDDEATVDEPTAGPARVELNSRLRWEEAVVGGQTTSESRARVNQP